ncbi:uncharacterized protein LOC129587871 [Paramacrobiotus metropolitanus]|uniref:uncharacterized protein LOC129587871 n=1 Tax=Paramacrobiotus metropolitanus TaxID=2943436 RepID=UPI002445C742|nr:uncharacterized protein LOC129587871 [Paramacrobiotus metropolitanus]
MSRASTVVNKLLKLSFDTSSLLFNELRFHNHTAHHLGALYFLGENDKRIEEIYHHAMVESSDPDVPSPHTITRANWRSILGDRQFCKAYKDYFEQELPAENWREKFLQILLENEPHPLINGVIGGVVHPLIHIGYALELDSRLVAVEALTQAAVCYDSLHDTVDKLQRPQAGTKSPMEVFTGMRADNRLPIFEKSDIDNIENCVKMCNDRILQHFNQWKMNSTLEKTIEDLFDVSLYIYGATHRPNEIVFDFFLLHLLTAMHAVRVTFPYLKDPKIAEHLLLQFFYFAGVLYVNQRRPEINEKLIDDYQLDATKTWEYVVDRAINTKLSEDSHLVKVIHTLRSAEKVYGSKNGLYLKAAVKTVDNLDLNIKHPEIDIPFPWVVAPEDPRQAKMNALQKQ